MSYTTTYAKCADGYQGRVYAQGVALSKVPRGIREIEYDGLSVRDWGVEMAYFAFSVQFVGKMKPEISRPYIRMDTLRLYLLKGAQSGIQSKKIIHTLATSTAGDCAILSSMERQ